MAETGRIRIICLKAQPMARRRLVIFPHAGAGPAVYRPWLDHFPGDTELVAVQLPGRESALGETPFRDWAAMLPALTAAIDTLPATPFALFGHSLGAVMALAAARHLAARAPQQLSHVFVSGRPWPGTPAPPLPQPDALGDEAFLEMMAARFGAAGAAMDNAEIRDLVLPGLRADVALLHSYRHAPAPLLPCPLTVFHGTDDPATAGQDMADWGAETTGPFAVQAIAGRHLFPVEAAAEVCQQINSALEDH